MTGYYGFHKAIQLQAVYMASIAMDDGKDSRDRRAAVLREISKHAARVRVELGVYLDHLAGKTLRLVQ